MSSKNNPDARGVKNKPRKYKGKMVKPVLYIERGYGKYMACQYEDGELVIDPQTGKPLAHKDADLG